MRISDWSSDVCSSDLIDLERQGHVAGGGALLDHAERRIAMLGDVDLALDQVDAAGLDAGMIEQVVDQAEQVAAAGENVAGIFAVARVAELAEPLLALGRAPV